jgi:hypothetical protein
MNMYNEEEPRRGASRANSVRFDESAIHGYYGQVNRSTSELPIRTPSGMSSHPLTERSLSHRSDGRQSSSGHSHHSARTNSLGLDGGRLLGSASASPSRAVMPPPGLFILGPVPCIIRCWLTTNFSNESLLYAAVCTGSYTSHVSYSLIEKLGMEELIILQDGLRYIKVPVYLPEAVVHQSSSRAGSPTPQLPAISVRFLLFEPSSDDKGIQILIGSDVLRSHNADILFSSDKMVLVDDDRNKVSVPLVRPEDDSTFKTLTTACNPNFLERQTNGRTGPAPAPEAQSAVGADSTSNLSSGVVPSSPSMTMSAEGPEFVENDKFRPVATEEESMPPKTANIDRKSNVESEEPESNTASRMDNSGVWGSWRRDGKADSVAIGMAKANRSRAMKVLRPSKSSSRIASISAQPASAGPETGATQVTDFAAQENEASGVNGNDIAQPTPSRSTSLKSTETSRSGKTRASNPVGGASAFGWLNSSQQPRRPTTSE